MARNVKKQIVVKEFEDILTSDMIRNPVHTVEGKIDCEVKHPIHGWIPFTADANDVVPHGRKIFELCNKMKVGKALPAPVELVKKKASDRIRKVAPEWKQSNANALAMRLSRKPQSEWTKTEKDDMAKYDAMWAEVDRIRAKSNEIEKMKEIPFDIENDSYWD